MEARPKLLYPLMVIAAISVTVFSLLGIATLTGTLPFAHSESINAGLPAAAVEQAAPRTDSPANGHDYAQHSPEPAPADSAQRGISSLAAACHNCGVVESVRLVETKGQGTGLGAVAGGVAGALLGNGMGQGNGRTAMTLLGAGGGAYVGNEIEKNTRKNTSYQIRVRMEDGTLRTLYQRQAPSAATGDRVKVVDGVVVQRS